MPKKKKTIIKPIFLKDDNGKKVEVFLDLKTYNAILKRIDDFEKKRKKAKKR